MTKDYAEKLLKANPSKNELRVILAMEADGGPLDIPAVQMATGLHRDRAQQSVKGLVDKGLVFQHPTPDLNNLFSPYRDVLNINNNNIIQPYSLNNLFNPTLEGLSYFEKGLGRGIAASQRSRSLNEIKIGFLKCYEFCRKEEFRGFQSFGLLRDIIDHYLEDGWYAREATQPVYLVMRKVSPYLASLPKKPSEVRDEELYKRKRFRYDVSTKRWRNTGESLTPRTD